MSTFLNLNVNKTLSVKDNEGLKKIELLAAESKFHNQVLVDTVFKAGLKDIDSVELTNGPVLSVDGGQSGTAAPALKVVAESSFSDDSGTKLLEIGGSDSANHQVAILKSGKLDAKGGFTTSGGYLTVLPQTVTIGTAPTEISDEGKLFSVGDGVTTSGPYKVKIGRDGILHADTGLNGAKGALVVSNDVPADAYGSKQEVLSVWWDGTQTGTDKEGSRRVMARAVTRIQDPTNAGKLLSVGGGRESHHVYISGQGGFSANGVALGSAPDGSGTAAVVVNADSAQPVTISRDVNMENYVLTAKDIVVQGTLTTKNSSEVNVGDSHIYLNAENTTDSNTSGGIVVNSKRVGEVYTVSAISETGNINIGIGTNTLENGDIIQISGSPNASANGLYVVGDKNGLLIQSTGTVPPFCKTIIPAIPSGGDTTKLCKVHLGHIMVDAEHAVVEFASGSTASDFDHESGKYFNYASRIEQLETDADANAAVMNIADSRGTFETMTLNQGVRRFPEDKRTIAVTSGTAEGMYMPPNDYVASITDAGYTLSYRIYNAGTTEFTIMSKPSASGDDAGQTALDWGEEGYIFGEEGDSFIRVSPYYTVNLTYVGDNRWAMC